MGRRRQGVRPVGAADPVLTSIEGGASGNPAASSRDIGGHPSTLLITRRLRTPLPSHRATHSPRIRVLYITMNNTNALVKVTFKTMLELRIFGQSYRE